ncbi:hypothetical protein MUY27_09995 [Mucilaginibacter sp. RS28]|uniref:Uncharacterized protein n=1 Tax=Mucilaginibacter straminoryzae TaxID=2932774 RepID=A0A9X1X4P6_9SPHI|nr:hypothetical protein [Mucilaginibacter straminoryzae]MCJ8210040.1 hypothetical protein [Mucilaginibacter straminoryzae]
MKKTIGFKLITIHLLFVLPCNAAHIKLKKDTIYYVVDTSKIPLKDRVILIGGKEGQYFSYRLMCSCNSWHGDYTFTRHVSKPGELINPNDTRVKNSATLRSLIQIATQHSEKKPANHVFYFIEAINNQYVKYQVFLNELLQMKINDSVKIQRK